MGSLRILRVPQDRKPSLSLCGATLQFLRQSVSCGTTVNRAPARKITLPRPGGARHSSPHVQDDDALDEPTTSRFPASALSNGSRHDLV